MEWISVKNRLPENVGWCNDRVLFLDKNGTIRIGNYDYEFVEWTDDCGGIYKNTSHWMPLPEPPK